MLSSKIFFFGKKNIWGDLALAYLKLLNQNVVSYRGDHGETFPVINEDSMDLIVSFACPWVLPKKLLERAKVAAINFHPGSPDYPGIGCTNFALYNNEKKFGVVSHHMLDKVDSGQIIETKYFPVFDDDTVKSITDRTYHYLYYLFLEVMDSVINKKLVPVSSEKWRREPFTRKELNDLCKITPDMSMDEISQRVRAVTFPGKPGAYIQIGNFTFPLEEKNDK